jgi:acyl carrier protein
MIQSIFPTTDAQQGFILGSLASNAADAVFVEQFTVPLKGKLHVGTFREALESIVKRHDILRTGFAYDVTDAPKQVLLKGVSPQIDFVETDPDRINEEINETLARHRKITFDFKRPPLLRLAIHRVKPDLSILVWTHHHAILDGWSQIIILSELVRRYNGVPLSALSASFGDYALWKNAQPDLHADYWMTALENFKDVARLTVESKRHNGDMEAYKSDILKVSNLKFEKLSNWAVANGVTVANVIIAIWAVAHSHILNSQKFVMGVTVSGREAGFEGIEGVVGPFASSIPIGVEIDTVATLGELSAQLQAQVASASNNLASVQKINRYLGLETGASLFDSVIAIANYPASDPIEGVAAYGSLSFDSHKIEGFGGKTLLPLALSVSLKDDVELRLVSRGNAFEEGYASRVLEFFASIIDETIEGLLDDEPVSKLRNSLGRNDQKSEASGTRAKSSEPNSMEHAIVELFRDTLNNDIIDQNSDFVDFGGHSLLAIELLKVMRERFNAEISLGQLLKSRTPGKLSELIRNSREQNGTSTIVYPSANGKLENLIEFPLSEIQEAYWAGRQGHFDLSSVDAHVYAEFDAFDVDVTKVERIWNDMIERHEMLRTVITSDAKQYFIECDTFYKIPVIDLTNNDQREEVIKETRNRLSASRRPLGTWPLFSIEAARLCSRTVRYFVSVDLLIGDAMSWKNIYSEMAQLYRDPDSSLTPIKIDFGSYVQSLSNVKVSEYYARDRAYWQARVRELPSPPKLKTVPANERNPSQTFSRFQFKLGKEETRKLRECAVNFGVTPSTLLLYVFGKALSLHTGEDDNLINLTVFNRLPLHPQIGSLVGPFTSLSLTAVSSGEYDTDFLTGVSNLQQQLWVDLDHRHYSGLEVMRLLSRLRMNQKQAQAPIVFTSTLDFSPEIPSPIDWKLVYSIGQTPQVLLDYQAYVIGGEVAIVWDFIAEQFSDGYIKGIFDENRRLLSEFGIGN